MIGIFKKSCCGCRACEKVCPVNAIIMKKDERGFLYPFVNEEKCVKCGLCVKRCPLNEKSRSNIIKAFAAYNKNEDIRRNSTSGGIFTALAENIINDGGIVFGAAFDNEFQVNHIKVEKVEDLKKLRTSKYVQSDTKNTFVETKEILETGKKVYYSGTPCQIEGLLSYLNKEYDNLITQDLICHGVPSPKAWKMYLDSKNKKIKYVNFRSKEKTEWEKYDVQINYDDFKEYINHNDDIYMKLFLRDKILRKSCYDCRFKKKNRLSDITLADFWGIDNVEQTMNDKKGTSLVIINSEKGNELFNSVSNVIIKKEVDLEQAILENPSMLKTSKESEDYDKITEYIITNNSSKLFIDPDSDKLN